MEPTALITPSWLPDLERCQQLTESVQKYTSEFTKHYVLVDHRDKAAFKASLSRECEIVVKEDLLPNWIHQSRLNRKWWWSLRALPVRGWILQQITKIGITQFLDEQAYCFVDSDTRFLKEFSARDLWQNEKLRFYRDERKPHFYESKRYRNWYGFAAKQLDLGDEQKLNGSYIAQLTTMRKDTVGQMLRQIEHKNKRNWIEVLARSLDFSEFILYGVFVDECAANNSGHSAMPESLCHSSWFFDIQTQNDIDQFVAGLSANQVAVHLQSNLRFDAAALEQALAASR